jgi:hypothetical protein
MAIRMYKPCIEYRGKYKLVLQWFSRTAGSCALLLIRVIMKVTFGISRKSTFYTKFGVISRYLVLVFIQNFV